MALVLADRVKETTTTTGTGTVTLLGASAGYQSFSAVGNANTTYYTIAGQTTSEWEVGIGTYTSSGTTLSRTTVLSSSNGGSLVTFSVGTKDVFVTYPSGRSVNVDAANTVVSVPQLSATSITNTGLTSGRVVFSTTGGLETDSANLTFSGSALAVTGTLSATGAVTFTGTTATLSGTGLGASNNILSVGNSTDSDAQLRLRPNSAERSWSIGASTLVASTLTITPSTTNGGSTFTTPVISISSTGLAVTGTLSATGTLSGGTSGTGYSFSGSAPATSLTLDSSGQLGIGEATPTQKVHAKTASTTYYLAETTGTSASAGFRMKAGASADYTLFTTQGVNQFAIYDNAAGSQRVTLDSSGNLGLGVTPSAWDASVYKALQISTNSSIASFTNGETRYSSNCFYNSSVWKYITSSQFASAYTQGAGAHTWYSAPSGTAGNAITFTQAMTLDASGNLGVGATSGFNALSGTETTVYIKNSGINVASLYLEGARKVAIFTGGAGQLAFYDITGAKELGQFDSSGNLLVGQTSTGLRNSNSLSLEPSASGAAFINHVNGSSSGNGYIFFGYNGSAIGSITQSGTTAVLYNTTSDYRLKTVTGVVTGQGARIDALKPIDYEWKEGSTSARGFLAHEFQEVYASSVSGTKDALDADGKPLYQSMQAATSEVIADLVAEIQSLRARVAQLESKP